MLTRAVAAAGRPPQLEGRPGLGARSPGGGPGGPPPPPPPPPPDAGEAAGGAPAAPLGVPARAVRVDPRAARAAGPSRDRPTLQEAARELRYAALQRMAEEAGAGCIATAHTADDQAETVLLRLLRGTGPDGLAGIPERSRDGRIVRPLLRVWRAELAAFASAQGLVWREDASNAKPDYTRNRLRLHWLPGLASQFNPPLLTALR